MRKCKLTDQERLAAVIEYLNGNGGYRTIAKKYNIHKSTLRELVNLYQTQGEQAIYSPSRNSYYSPELKRQAVEAYLSGEGGLQDICNKFHIRSRSQLRDWIRLYNGHNKSRSRVGHRSDIYMTKGRETTLEERVEIVSFCIEHGKDYSLTIQQYGVSYNQIYSWVRKYEADGVEGLRDRRGKKKSEAEMDETDRLKAQIKLLQAENRQLEVELAVRKKLQEIEGRRR